MTLRDGKFYDAAGHLVPLEFGNQEQIKLMQTFEREERELKEGCMLSFDTHYDEQKGECEMYSEFKCPCGDLVTFKMTAIDEITAYSLIDGLRRTCSCMRRYGVDLHESDGYMVLRLISKKQKP